MSHLCHFRNGRIEVLSGDITQLSCDAIVNAANRSLMGGGGVDGAIHRAGGPAILEECKKIRRERFPEGLPTGQAVATAAGNLPVRFVFHTVGPIWKGGNSGEDEMLASCYRECLKLARELKCAHVAFPSISCGVYGFPKVRAAGIVARVLQEEMQIQKQPSLVSLVFFSPDDARLFLEHAGGLFRI